MRPDLTPWFLALFAGESALMMALSAPLIKGKIKPNSIYGVRTPRSLADEDSWYRANLYGGRLLFSTGFVQLITVLALFAVPRLRDDFVAYNLACGATILGGLLFAGILLIARLRSL